MSSLMGDDMGDVMDAGAAAPAVPAGLVPADIQSIADAVVAGILQAFSQNPLLAETLVRPSTKETDDAA